MADLRQACDRCHDKKLRCSKPPESNICGRCAKANVPCDFSPPTRSQRNGTGRNLTRSDSIQFNNSTPFNWSSLIAFDQIPSPGSFNSTPPVSDRVEQSPSSSTNVSQLADLMASLDLIHHGFPPKELRHLPADQIKLISENTTASFALQTTLEQLLLRTQQLASLYPLVLNCTSITNEPSQASEDDLCTIPNCVHQITQSLQSRPKPKLDHALFSLLSACHLRLLDILDDLTGHAKLCARVVELLPKDQEPRFDMPEVRIGSFIAPKASAASMLLSMMIELQSSLTARCQDLFKLISGASDDAPREAGILAMQYEALGERSVATLDDLRTIRNHLQKLGLMG